MSYELIAFCEYTKDDVASNVAPVPTATLYNGDLTDGAAVGSMDVTRVKTGVYKATYTSESKFNAIIHFYTTDADVRRDVHVLYSKWRLDIVDTLAGIAADVWGYASRTLTSLSGLLSSIADAVYNKIGSTVTVVSPHSQTGTLTLYAGDDYDSDDGRQLEFSSDGWPDLTGATVKFVTDGLADVALTLDTVGAEVTQQVSLELTAAQTMLLSGNPVYKIVATLAESGHTIRLETGTIEVEA